MTSDMSNMLVVLDFDHTIIEGNVDISVRDLLQKGVPTSVEFLHSHSGWTRYMQEIFRLVAKEGFTEEDIIKTIVSCDPTPDFLTFLKSLKKMKANVIIISDSNSYFIRTWLEDFDLVKCIDRTFTNPAEFEDGVLQIKEYMNQDWCSYCTVNLCKGHVLESYQEEMRFQNRTFSRVFYIGDGKNDYCPALRLRKEDIVFPRIGFPLLGKVKDNEMVKANVYPWSHTRDITEVIKAFVPS